MKKIFAIPVILFLLNITIYCQEKGSYISFNLKANNTALHYDLKDANRNTKLSIGGKVNYSYFFDKHWGIGTGLEILSYTSSEELNSFQQVFKNQVDKQGDTYDLIITLAGDRKSKPSSQKWTESQKAIFLDVPITLNFQHKIDKSGKLAITGHAGLKLQIPISGRYKTNSQTYTREGYYPKWNVLLYDLPEHGFADYQLSTSNKINYRLGLSLTSGIGILARMNDYSSLYAGIFYDYGLKNIKPKTEKELIGIDQENELIYNGIHTSKSIKDIKTSAFGIELGVRFYLNNLFH